MASFTIAESSSLLCRKHFFLPTKPKLKPLPDAVRAALGKVGVNGDAVLQLQTDLDSNGQFGERYLVATPHKLVVVANNGSAHIEREVPLSEIGRIESRGLSGTTSLEARLKTREGEKVVELIRGSNGRAREMSQAAEKNHPTAR